MVPESVDLIAICVPTPAAGGVISLAAVRAALRDAARAATLAAPGLLVAIRSTLMPGHMSALRSEGPAQAIRALGGSLCYWPSFARERCADSDELSPRVVVFGTDHREPVQRVLGRWLQSATCDVHLLTDEEAELAKAGSNAFNATKISFFNALSDWAATFGADGARVASVVVRAAEGAWNPAYGTAVGPAFGGACLPKDLQGLLSALRDVGGPHAELLESVLAVNRSSFRSAPGDSG